MSIDVYVRDGLRYCNRCKKWKSNDALNFLPDKGCKLDYAHYSKTCLKCRELKEKNMKKRGTKLGPKAYNVKRKGWPLDGFCPISQKYLVMNFGKLT